MTKNVTNFIGTLGMVLVFLAIMPSTNAFAKNNKGTCNDDFHFASQCNPQCKAPYGGCPTARPSSGCPSCTKP